MKTLNNLFKKLKKVESKIRNLETSILNMEAWKHKTSDDEQEIERLKEKLTKRSEELLKIVLDIHIVSGEMVMQKRIDI